jgi:hypothetical protein
MEKRTVIFIFCFFIINLLQAAYTQLTGDEALYWMYWNELDFGFRDHPPLIGVIIGAGYSFLKSELGVRLFVAVANSVMLIVLFKLVKPAVWWQFALLVLSIPVLSLYGFIATPDVPLLPATALYFLVWRRFIENQTTANTWLLGGCMALLMWSKYQGIFIILFTLLPLRKLWWNKQFWLAALVGVLLFSPHLIWQATHDLLTIKFHLNDRNSDAWELKHILGYALGQLGVFNPIVFVLTIYVMVISKASTDFERSMRWVFTVTLLLFFFNSFRGRVEPHWTAPLTLAAIFLICNYWRAHKPSNSISVSLAAFAAIILLARVFMVVDVLPQLNRDFHRNRQKMEALHELAGNSPVCFMNSYQNPSLYMFYTSGKAHSINNIDGGKNQYDYWNYASLCNQEPFLFVASYDHPAFIEKKVGNFSFHTKEYADLPVLGKLYLKTDDWRWEVAPNDSLIKGAWLINNNSYTVQFSLPQHSIVWTAEFNHKKPNEASAAVSLQGLPNSLQAGDSARVTIKMQMPNLQGENKMCVAAKVDDLPATYQSNWVRVEVNK